MGPRDSWSVGFKSPEISSVSKSRD